MAAGTALSAKSVTAALRSEGGTVARAARKLGVTREALSRFVKKNGLADVLDEMREDLCDVAEDGLRTATERRAPWAVRYALDTLGKRRGYIKRIPDVVSAANLDALKRIVAHLGLEDVDDMTLITAVVEVRAEMDAERGSR